MTLYKGPLDLLAEHGASDVIIETDFSKLEERVLAFMDLNPTDLEEILENIYDVDL